MRHKAQKPLNVVEKEARARGAAKRQTSREVKGAAEPMDMQSQLESEDTIQGVHYVSLEEVTEDGQDESAPVGSGEDSSSDSSVEVVDVSVSDTHIHAVDDNAEQMVIPDETSSIKLEGSLSTAKEEWCLGTRKRPRT
ncbi:hypothetical protein PHPALM_31072 [Phytophthora palmivora]|uniref:Uncharacterized protein n=1 Tax=Phytophthora palmivora TaxID=4796 RepID=A0A2P4X3J0_9STRA|nr:hypothetical protein PHPALM_31072 [Phytophthora palmivora]